MPVARGGRFGVQRDRERGWIDLQTGCVSAYVEMRAKGGVEAGIVDTGIRRRLVDALERFEHLQPFQQPVPILGRGDGMNAELLRVKLGAEPRAVWAECIETLLRVGRLRRSLARGTELQHGFIENDVWGEPAVSKRVVHPRTCLALIGREWKVRR